MGILTCTSFILFFFLQVYCDDSLEINQRNLWRGIKEFSMLPKLAGDPASSRALKYVNDLWLSLNLTIISNSFRAQVPAIDRHVEGGLWLVNSTDNDTVLFSANLSSRPLHYSDQLYAQSSRSLIYGGICPVDFFGEEGQVIILSAFSYILNAGRLSCNYSAGCLYVIYEEKESSNFDDRREFAKIYPRGPGAPDSAVKLMYPLWCPSKMQSRHSGMDTSQQSPPTSQALLVSYADARTVLPAKLRTLGSQIRIRARWPVSKKPMLLQNICGKLSGRGVLKKQLVILGCHRDAVGPGALDPGTGHTLLQELARLLTAEFSNNRNKAPRRSIMFCSWDAEEFGALGTKQFISDFHDMLSQQLVAYVNLDTVLFGNHSLRTLESAVLRHMMEDVLSRIPDPVTPEVSLSSASKSRRPVFHPRYYRGRSDDRSFLSILSIPSISFVYDSAWSQQEIYPLYHTAYETPHLLRLIDPRGHILLTVGKAYLEVLRRLLTDPLVSTSPTSVLDLLPTADVEDVDVRAVREQYLTSAEYLNGLLFTANLSALTTIMQENINKKLIEVGREITKMDQKITVPSARRYGRNTSKKYGPIAIGGGRHYMTSLNTYNNDLQFLSELLIELYPLLEENVY